MIKIIVSERFKSIYKEIIELDKYLENLTENKKKLPLIRFDLFKKMPFIEHGFTTRIGGVSEGIYSSLNLSFTRGDENDKVLENYRIIAKEIGFDINDFVASHQTHTTNIKVVGKSDKGKGITRERDYENIDGLMTNEPGIVLFTYYADCVPLYFVDRVKKVIALSHSGWKGTVNKMGKVTVEKMISEFGCNKEDIICAIGPSICKKCYEVSEDVAIEFKKNFRSGDVCKFLEDKKNGKYQLDLWKANELILEEAGIQKNNIENRKICTCCNRNVMFSHRGSGGKRGNLAAFMVIK